MKNFFNQIGFFFTCFNTCRNILVKIRNPKILLGRGVVVSNVHFDKFGSLGSFVKILNSKIGNHTYISDYSIIDNTQIGKYCSIGSGVKIGLGIHPTRDFVSTHPIFYSTKKQSGNTYVSSQNFVEQIPVKIGNDVWIGANVVILDGVEIGDGAIIAAGAVVTKNVNPYEIVGGVPANHLRYRFSESEIQKLISLKWWNKDEAWIKKNLASFQNVKDFCQPEKLQ